MPARSAVKVGFTLLALLNTAVLPEGSVIRLQLFVNASPSTSVDPAPFSWMIEPITETWLGPAFATGGAFCVVIVTVLGVLSTFPSLTTSCATYVPAMSAENEDKTAWPFCSVAPLPLGRVISVQLYVSGSPSTSDELLPFRVTVAPTA